MSQVIPTTFLTGATGLLGHYVLRDLLLKGRRVVAMLRAPLAVNRERLAEMLTPLAIELDEYIDSGRLILVEGALPDELPEPTWGRIDEIVACAASLQLLSNGNMEPQKTNVLGTQELLRWADQQGVTNLHAVSTAYVCGFTSEIVREEFHRAEPTFQTDYERTKWIAESMLLTWAAQPGRTLTLYRPSFLVGDSMTGYTTQFNGFYQAARLISILKEQHKGHNSDLTYIPLRIPARPETPFQNLVPVDYASQVIAEVVCQPQFHGRIYHLTDPSPPKFSDFKSCMEEYFGLHGGYFADAGEMSRDMNTAESLLWEKYDLLMPRIQHTPDFDSTNVHEVLAAAGLAFPALDRDRFFTLLDYAESKGWGNKSNGRLARSH
jgi:nucleoside-diphosphate-sugar epimerase